MMISYCTTKFLFRKEGKEKMQRGPKENILKNHKIPIDNQLTM